MNTTNAFYHKLSASPQEVKKLAQAVEGCSLEESQQRLQELLAHHAMSSQSESLDYTRLAAFLRNDFSGWDLHNEDFSGMSLAGANLRGANLSGANLSNADLRGANLNAALLNGANLSGARCGRVHLEQTSLRSANLRGASLTHAQCALANFSQADLTLATCTEANFTKAICEGVLATGIVLTGATLDESSWNNALLRAARLEKVKASKAQFFQANLEHAILSDATFDEARLSYASCSFGNWFSANLRAAVLDNSDFSFSNLTLANIESASLRYVRCFSTQFGTSLRYDDKTTIDDDNHDLIAQVLFSHARTPRQRQLALYIRHTKDHCWNYFFALLLREKDPDMVEWAKAALSGIGGLQTRIETYTALLSERLAERSKSLDLQDVNVSLHTFIAENVKQHPSLEGEELYWFLRGLLAHARQQPEIALSEEQYAAALARFQSIAHPF